MSTAHDCKTEGSLLFSLDERRVRRAGSRLGLPLDATELLRICEDEVHVLGGLVRGEDAYGGIYG